MRPTETLRKDHQFLREQLVLLEGLLPLGGAVQFPLRDLTYSLAVRLRSHVEQEEALLAGLQASFRSGPIEGARHFPEAHKQQQQTLTRLLQLLLKGNKCPIAQVTSSASRLIDSMREAMAQEEDRFFPAIDETFEVRRGPAASADRGEETGGVPGAQQRVSVRRMNDLEPGEHLCGFYETEEQHRAMLTQFLREGLTRGEKVLYIVEHHTPRGILEYVGSREHKVQRYLASGQLSLRSVGGTYLLLTGTFRPESVIRWLQTETDRALAEGYRALRVTGEMTWMLTQPLGSTQLLEYESRLKAWLPGSHCLQLCQYDRRGFESELLWELLLAHPTIAVGSKVYDQIYHLPASTPSPEQVGARPSPGR